MPASACGLQNGLGVYLRHATRGDCTAFIEAAKRSRGLHGSWVSAPCDGDAFGQLLEKSQSERNEVLLVCAQEPLDGASEIAGVFNLNEIVRGCFQSAYLGYYAFEPYAGSGLMSEGLQLTMRHSFQTLKLHRLEANIQPGNEASIALVKRAGFRREGFSPRYLKINGRWRDHERWAILREEWG